MAEKKSQTTKKSQPVKKSVPQPKNTVPLKKPTSTGASKKRTVVPKPKPVVQTDYWQKNINKIKAWLRGWWDHGLQEEPSASLSKKRKKTAIRIQTGQPRQTPRPRPARSTASGIHLVGKEEHRCPYCLEEVKRNDPRGVKICPICHTHHHADCWAVTGACQVPHYHE